MSARRTESLRTQVAIVGAGPAGLSLAHMLALQGIGAVVLERSTQEHVRSRIRAGVLENTTVDTLGELGVADRLHREALRHNGFYLRFDEHTHHLDFHADSGRNAYVYGQAEVVADLIDALPQRGEPVVFGADEVSVHDFEGSAPYVEFNTGGVHRTLHADFIAGCDGFHGACRAAVSDRLTTLERSYPFAWLGILAHSKPVTEEGMYCAHAEGLSVHSMRGPELSRQYLQVDADTDLAEWPDERIWTALRRRSHAVDAPELETGEIIDKSLAPLRSLVTEPMRVGSLFLLGDAAHIMPPTGAKGLNLAVSDATVLSHALGGYYAEHRTDLLDDYSSRALGRIWAAQSFSWELTSVLHRFEAPGDDASNFARRLRLARLRRWTTSDDERRALGEVYLGLPFPTAWRYT